MDNTVQELDRLDEESDKSAGIREGDVKQQGTRYCCE
jgi:hypothetical protein